MRFIKRGMLFLLAGVMAFGSAKSIFSDGQEASYKVYATSSIDKAEERKQELEEKKKETEKKIASLETEKDNILVYIEKLDQQLGQIQMEIEDLNTQIDQVDKRLIKAEEELEEAKEQEEKQYNSMKLRIKYMYENGDSDYISMLLGAESFSDFLNRAEYIAKISEYDRKSYENYEKLKQQVIDKQNQLEERKAELGSLKEELAYEEETVTRLSEDKSAELVKYQEKIDLADNEAAAYQEEIEKQEQLIEDLLEQRRKQIEEEERKKREEEEQRKREEEERRRREEAAQNQPSSGNANEGSEEESAGQVSASGFVWPLSVSGTITSYFGYRDQPTAGASTYHKGIDIGAPTGTSILATAGGTVVTAAYSASAGNYIMIFHGNSTYTVYMHCSSLSVSEGQTVSQGQTIAAVGSTGVSTGPHLHFGVSVNGEYVNPLNYVSQ